MLTSVYNFYIFGYDYFLCNIQNANVFKYYKFMMQNTLCVLVKFRTSLKSDYEVLSVSCFNILEEVRGHLMQNRMRSSERQRWEIKDVYFLIKSDLTLKRGGYYLDALSGTLLKMGYIRLNLWESDVRINCRVSGIKMCYRYFYVATMWVTELNQNAIKLVVYHGGPPWIFIIHCRVSVLFLICIYPPISNGFVQCFM